jgi:PAS domain-containing protein
MLGAIDVYAGWVGVPASSWSQHLGWFRFYLDDGRWVWSPHLEQMHGYRPGTVTPRTEVMLSHIHPDDHRRVADTLHDMRRTARPFNSRHRIVDTRNRTHDVVVIAAPFRDVRGHPVGMLGVCLDMTPTDTAKSRDDEVAARLLRHAENGHSAEQRRRVRAATRC